MGALLRAGGGPVAHGGFDLTPAFSLLRAVAGHKLWVLVSDPANKLLNFFMGSERFQSGIRAGQLLFGEQRMNFFVTDPMKPNHVFSAPALGDQVVAVDAWALKHGSSAQTAWAEWLPSLIGCSHRLNLRWLKHFLVNSYLINFRVI